MAKATLVVFTNPISEEQDANYNDWYNSVHLNDVVSVPGFVSAQRFRLCDVEVTPGATPPLHRYLALYQVEGADIGAIATALMERAGTDRMILSPALDEEGATAFFYEPIGAPVEADLISS